MASPLQQLENNEAVLLMYVAGELPHEDRLEVEQMLAIDAGMRSELESLRDGQVFVESALGELDSLTRLPMSAAVAVRRLGPALATWQAQRTAPPVRAAAAPALRYAWWVYPVGSAAAILLAAVVWWGVHSDDHAERYVVNSDGTTQPNSDGMSSTGEFTGPGDAQFARADPMFQMDPQDHEFADAEQQAVTLTRRGDGRSSMSSIFMTDATD